MNTSPHCRSRPVPPTGRDAAINQPQEIVVDYILTPDDFDRMHLLARISSRGPDSLRWTELAIYFDTEFADKIRKRPFVGLVEGHSIVPGERLKRQFAAVGSLRRALDWFEDSDLADNLQRAVELEIGDPELSATEVLEKLKWCLKPQPELVLTESRRPDLPSLTAALAWLYPGDDLSERALALAFERDFGMLERTVRNTLAIEAGRVKGKVGPWVKPMLVALRWIDRAAWEKRDA